MNFDDELTSDVKKLSLEHGFARVGIALAGPIASLSQLRHWLESPYPAEMEYLRRNIEKRLCPSKLMPGARCVICLAVGFRLDHDTPAHIAAYARGRDYHKVLKARAHKLCDAIRLISPQFHGRAFVDTAPLAERALAVACGIGWIGRNGMVIVPGLGSCVVLAEIVCNLPLRPDKPITGSCGDCRECMTKCPTGAIVSQGIIDCRACLSYHTIENRGKIPKKLWPILAQRVFGCDTCLRVCPYNHKTPPSEAELPAPTSRNQATLSQMLRWSREQWDTATRGRAIRRASYEMFLRNAVIAAGNSDDARLTGPLRALQATAPALAEEIAWALGQIDSSKSSLGG